MAPILPASASIPAISAPTVPAAPSSGGGDAFQSAFSEAVSKVDSFQHNAQASIDRFISGQDEELHHVAIATEQAEMTFEMFMQVRNKIVAAYQQVMEMQV